jgi:hypothetical protein
VGVVDDILARTGVSSESPSIYADDNSMNMRAV